MLFDAKLRRPDRFGRCLLSLLSLSALTACVGEVGSSSASSADASTAVSTLDEAGRSPATLRDAGGALVGKESDGGGSEEGDAPKPAFAPLTPAAYVAKVKGLLTGDPATADEVSRVESAPESLQTLIAEWQKSPGYRRRMLSFFTMAFQQGDVTAAMILNASPFQQGPLDPRIIQNMRESFGRTALALVESGAPFTEVLTTRRFMVTPALALALAWLDERQSGDGGGVADALNEELGPAARYEMLPDEQIPLDQSTNPAHENFLRFHSPQVAAATGDCRKPIVVNGENRLTLYTLTLGETLMNFILGRPFSEAFCRYPARENIFGARDFDTWRMVTLRKPRAGERPTRVYEIGRLRAAEELVLERPYVGFYTTPAFLYTWQTNSSNQARVTINQTLIVATGQRFDGSHRATPTSTAALDSKHAAPDTPCYGCHIAMDPMRQFFRGTYTLFWSLQRDKKQTALPMSFVLSNVAHAASDISALGQSLAKSPRFAAAWTEKLCMWANGAWCSDPELERVAAVFADSGYDWNTLVRALFSSPVVTYAAPTEMAASQGVALSVLKRDQLCQLWDQRLGLTDVCGLRALPSAEGNDAVRTIATVLPSDSYSRGQLVPTLASEPGLFFFSSVENACRALSQRVVDAPRGMALFDSQQVEVALDNMVQRLMGLTPPTSSEARQLLADHFANAEASGATPTVALRSTFVLACQSPSTVIAGL